MLESSVGSTCGRDSGAAGALPAETRRARILRATVEVLAEHGFAGATVGLVAERARVSRRTLRESFGGLEACVVAVFDQAAEYVTPLMSRALETDGSWQDRLRATLVAALCFFDAQPALARVAIVEALAGGWAVLAGRERVVESVGRLVAERIEGEVPYTWPLAGEMMLTLVLAMMYRHLAARNRYPLVGLLAPLMAAVIAPYNDELAIAEELARSQVARRADRRRARPRRPCRSRARRLGRDGGPGPARQRALAPAR